MTFDEIKLGDKCKLVKQVDFYNSRSGMFAYFEKDLLVEVVAKHPGVTSTVMVRFPGAKVEVLPSVLELRRK